MDSAVTNLDRGRDKNQPRDWRLVTFSSCCVQKILN